MDPLVRTLGYAIFLSTFVPLIFGGKIYNSDRAGDDREGLSLSWDTWGLSAS